jgi:hypothetical protein
MHYASRWPRKSPRMCPRTSECREPYIGDSPRLRRWAGGQLVQSGRLALADHPLRGLKTVPSHPLVVTSRSDRRPAGRRESPCPPGGVRERSETGPAVQRRPGLLAAHSAALPLRPRPRAMAVAIRTSASSTGPGTFSRVPSAPTRASFGSGTVIPRRGSSATKSRTSASSPPCSRYVVDSALAVRGLISNRPLVSGVPPTYRSTENRNRRRPRCARKIHRLGHVFKAARRSP